MNFEPSLFPKSLDKPNRLRYLWFRNSGGGAVIGAYNLIAIQTMWTLKKGAIGGLATLMFTVVTAISGFAQTVAYYSMQHTNWPPLPAEMFPGLPVYSLGGG